MNYTTKITERTVFNCFICGRETSKTPHEYNRLKDKRVVCSKECDHSKKSIKQREKLESKLKIKSLKVWLNDKYHVERMTTREIAKLMYGRKTHSPNVGAWIKRLGLEVRSGSEAVAMQWENNPGRRKATGERMIKNMAAGTEGRRKLIEVMQTEEYRLKSSIVKRGKNNPMYGVVRESHPMWNETITEEERLHKRNYKEYDDWRLSVYERDGYICVKCGYSKGGILEAHHINGYDWDVENRINIDNGITLCEHCHKDFHGKYGYGGNTKEQLDRYMEVKSEQLTLI